MEAAKGVRGSGNFVDYQRVHGLDWQTLPSSPSYPDARCLLGLLLSVAAVCQQASSWGGEPHLSYLGPPLPWEGGKFEAPAPPSWLA